MGGFVYKPRGAARKLFGCRDMSILYEGPAGTGKTRSCLEKAFAIASKYKNSRQLFLRQTRASMTESVLATWENIVIKPHDHLKAGAERKFREKYKFPNDSVIVCGGLDKAEKYLSTEWDIIWIFEAIEVSEHHFETAFSRLGRGHAVPYTQIICDTNPWTPNHWLNKRASEGKMTRILARHTDNPLWYQPNERGELVLTAAGDRYINQVLGSLTGPRRERLLNGKWCQAEGLVYERWDASVHVVKRFDVPAEWERFRSIDFGFVNPAVCQWWAKDGDGRLYLYRELYASKMTTDQLAREVIRLSGSERYSATVADHDAGDREILRQAGIVTMAAKKDVREGINRVQERLTVQGDGLARLYVFADALVSRCPVCVEAKRPCGVVEEVEGYVWADNQKRDEPVKADDHALDAMRYAVMYADSPRVMFRV